MATINNTNNQKLYYWFALMALFAFSLVTGLIGFYSYFNLHNETYTWLPIVYCTLQLFAFEGGDLQGGIPWALEIARFSAATTTTLAIISALFGIFREQWNRLVVYLMRNHVIIIGFGTKGKNVLKENLSKKKKVVIIDNNPFNPNLSLIKSSKCRFLLGDATNENILLRAAITKAQMVFLMMGDDNNEINVGMKIYQIVKNKDKFNKEHPLHCIMHLQKKEFLNTMRNHKVFQDINDGLALNIFNIYENSARVLFEEHPPDGGGITIQSEEFVQIIIFGFGKSGEALALQTAITGHYINGEKPSVLIYDQQANEKVNNFLNRYPSFTTYCEIQPITMEAESPQLIHSLTKYINIPNALTSLVLCFDNKTLNMLMGLQLLSMKPDENGIKFATIFVRTDDNESLKRLSDELIPYGLPSKVCSQKYILEGELDKKAKAIHKHYLLIREKEADFKTMAADVDWNDLPQEYKDSNRKAADHIGVKIRSIACKIVGKNDKRPQAIFSQEEFEKLSELEHRRWNAERSLAGWTFDKKKNNKTRRTPYLTDWEKLPKKIKDYDRTAVKNIHQILDLVEMKVVRIEMANVFNNQ